MAVFCKYLGLEQLGHMADRQAGWKIAAQLLWLLQNGMAGGIVQAITEGNYRPNPNADSFSASASAASAASIMV